MRSSGEEEVAPKRHQEMFDEAKDNHLSSETLCNVAGVSTLQTPSEEQPTEEDNGEGSGLSKDLNVHINDCSITETEHIINCSPGLQEILTSSEENVPETPEGGDSGETRNPGLGEIETRSSSVDTHGDDSRESCNNIFEEPENKQEDVQVSSLSNTGSCPQQRVTEDVMKERLTDESVPAVSNIDAQQEPENAEEAENDEAEEMSSKRQAQGATASGKKKRKKRRGKKKGGTQEDKNQQKHEADKEKDKTDKDTELATRDSEQTTEPDIDGSVTETLEESGVDQVKNEQETEQVDGAEAVKPSETFSHSEPLEESGVDHVTDVTDEKDNEQTLQMDNVEQLEATETFSPTETPEERGVDHIMDEQKEEQSLEAETVKAVEAVAATETFSQVETLQESRVDPKKDEQDEEQSLEPQEEMGSTSSPVPEANLSTPDLIDISEGADNTDKVCVSSEDNSNSGADLSTNGRVIHAESEVVGCAEDDIQSVDEMKPECTTNNPETKDKDNSEAESHVQSIDDIVTDESESTNKPESEDNMSVSLSSPDGFTDGLNSLAGSDLPSELSAAVNFGSDDTPSKVSDRDPEEATETVKDDEEPVAETEQESISPGPHGDNSELKPDRTEEVELSRNLREPEGLVEPDNSSYEGESDSASLTKNTEKSLLDTAAQAEQSDDLESQTLQREDQIGEVSSETEAINIVDISNTPDAPTEAPEAPEDHNNEEEPENDQQSAELHEPSKDQSEDNDSSQPTLQDSDEEDGEDDEGQSFDFDDMDVELAIETKVPKNQEEAKEGTQVMSRSGLCQSNTQSNENAQDEPGENNDETCTVDGGNQADTPDKETDTVPHEEAMSADVAVAVEPVIEEGKDLIVGELDVVAENVNQAMSLPVEEGLDAIKEVLQGEDLVLPKSADSVTANKETGKDVKKNGKKGKVKGREECKVS